MKVCLLRKNYLFLFLTPFFSGCSYSHFFPGYPDYVYESGFDGLSQTTGVKGQEATYYIRKPPNHDAFD